MITYKQYFSDSAKLHAAYHDQFVTDSVLSIVTNRIGADRIKKSTDKYFNDIPLKEWDRIIGFSDIQRPSISNTLGISNAIREAGDCVSAATLVCVMKAAAERIRKGAAHANH